MSIFSRKSLFIKFLICFCLVAIVSDLRGSSYKGQKLQDKFINEKFFKNLSGGVFVDIGAHNGVKFSNTYFFETNLNWSGICVEPIPSVFKQLRKNRSCCCIQGGIGENEGIKDFIRAYGPLRVEMLSGFLDTYDARHLERLNAEIEEFGGGYEIISIRVYNINSILEDHGLSTIDLLSLDTEGGELEILKSWDFCRFPVRAMIVENNYKDPEMEVFLKTRGYQKAAQLDWDEVYVLANEMYQFDSVES